MGDGVHYRINNSILQNRILRQKNAFHTTADEFFNPLNPELNPICYLLALLGAHHFLHVSRIRVKLLTFRRLMSYTGCPKKIVPFFIFFPRCPVCGEWCKLH